MTESTIQERCQEEILLEDVKLIKESLNSDYRHSIQFCIRKEKNLDELSARLDRIEAELDRLS